jgi:hypothetical protein
MTSSKEPFPTCITTGDKYGPAMLITDQTEADEYFERCVAHNMSFGQDRQEAEHINRVNLGYWAGYYSSETRARVEKLFRCSHPIFGAIAEVGVPTPEEAFQAGIARGNAK